MSFYGNEFYHVICVSWYAFVCVYISTPDYVILWYEFHHVICVLRYAFLYVIYFRGGTQREVRTIFSNKMGDNRDVSSL